MKLQRRIESLWKKWRPGPAHFKSVKFVESMSEVPDETNKDIYVVGSRAAPKWAVLECPCERKHRLQVPLMRSVHPHWTLSVRKGEASLSPSISVDNDPCTSHFWLRCNRIEWARWAWED